MWAVAFTDAASVFIERDIPDPVKAVFDGPMATD
jgi:hypothetical protein